MNNQQVADYLGVDRATISRWTHDRSPVKPAFLRQIALLSGVSYEWIADGVEGQGSDPKVNSGWSTSCAVISLDAARTVREDRQPSTAEHAA